ncbi:hypothetical protein [Cryptosporangium sp. NPDC048952]|uniref:hypothetical protein n=1 Tax=Cryptosporangium sp. NPDC048952 TaxID=3363961 RepID=UPI00371DD846
MTVMTGSGLSWCGCASTASPTASASTRAPPTTPRNDRRDLHNGRRQTYTTVEGDEDGEVTVMWLNVATLEVGDAQADGVPATRRPSHGPVR